MNITVPNLLPHYPVEGKRQLLTVLTVVVKTLRRSHRPLPDDAPAVEVDVV
jgi:hypothetical protein